MSQIKITNLTFAYEGTYDNIFENVSFQIDTNWKLGFTGRNGRGKTTFMRLLLGDLSYKGSIHASVHFDYFPYAVADMSLTTLEVIENIEPHYEYWALCKELHQLELDEVILDRVFNTLSQGERTKVLLAILFLKSNNFLLIDEPTNHLDLEGRECVSNYLKCKKGFILISHDRMFLDHIIDHVLSINKTNIEIQKGNFSSWMQNKAYQDQFEIAENEKLLKDIHRLGESAKRTAGWSDLAEKNKFGSEVVDRGFAGHKAAKLMKRAKAISQRREKAVEDKKKLLKNIEAADALEIKQVDHFSNTYLTVESLSVNYGKNAILSDLTFKIEKGNRIAIIGSNGSGKSSLLKAILHSLGIKETESSSAKEPVVKFQTTGNIKGAKDLVISYVSQDTSHLKGTLKDYALEHALDESLFKSMLSKLDFDVVQFEKDIRFFSEGQKKKVLLAKSICDRAHLYIWDEPLNYVDVLSRVQIEEMLLFYAPTMIFVEHDQAFIENIATEIIELG
ncbi:ribosomal protection-like ABC-F family protein [Fusibacter bizertensis]